MKHKNNIILSVTTTENNYLKLEAMVSGGEIPPHKNMILETIPINLDLHGFLDHVADQVCDFLRVIIKYEHGE